MAHLLGEDVAVAILVDPGEPVQGVDVKREELPAGMGDADAIAQTCAVRGRLHSLN